MAKDEKGKGQGKEEGKSERCRGIVKEKGKSEKSREEREGGERV